MARSTSTSPDSPNRPKCTQHQPPQAQAIDLVAGAVELQARRDVFHYDALQRRGVPAHRWPRFTPLSTPDCCRNRDRNAERRASH